MNPPAQAKKRKAIFVNNPVNAVNNPQWLLRRQLAQARKEVSRTVAMRLVKINRKTSLPNPDAALERIVEFEGRMNEKSSHNGL